MEGKVQRMSFSEECIKLIERKIGGSFFDFLRSCIRRTLISNIRGWNEEDVDDLTNEFFLKKFNIICSRLLEENISNPRAYICRVVENFCWDNFGENPSAPRTLSLDAKINASDCDDSDSTEFSEVISAEVGGVTDIYIDALAQELLDELYKLCNDKRADMVRYICFLISSRYYHVDDFRDSSWSQSNVYKIVERTRKFLEDFQEQYSIENKVFGRVLYLFYETYCQRNNV